MQQKTFKCNAQGETYAAKQKKKQKKTEELKLKT